MGVGVCGCVCVCGCCVCTHVCLHVRACMRVHVLQSVMSEPVLMCTLHASCFVKLVTVSILMYVKCILFVQRFEPHGRRLGKFCYYFYYAHHSFASLLWSRHIGDNGCAETDVTLTNATNDASDDKQGEVV